MSHQILLRRPPILAAVLAAFALIAAGFSPALAQPPGGGDGAVKARAVAQFNSAKPGATLVVAVVLDHAKGYHTWPEKAVVLPKDVDEFAQRTAITVPELPKGGWLERVGDIQWPEAKPHKTFDPTGEKETITIPLYAEQAVVYVPLVISPKAEPGEQSVTLHLYYQSCNDQTCEQPQDRDFPISVKILAAGDTSAPAANEPALFKDYKPGAIASAPKPAIPTPGPAPAAGHDPTKMLDLRPVEAVIPSQPSIFGLNFGGGPIVLFLVAALGGFILNLTPCVLPVIPIKVLTLTKQASTPRHALILGLWMALGVVAFWALAGIPMAFVSRAFDPSRYIFGVWWIALSIGLIIGFLGLGIMGLFMINLPNSVYAFNPRVDNAHGSFLFGILTAVLGLPCFGFVAGGLLAGTATLPAATIMLVFIGIGVGMAAPYLVLSAKPNLLKFLPKTGPASNLVKQVMGLLLMAAAAYFVAAGIRGLVHEKPYMSESMAWWAVTFFVAVAGFWLTLRILQIAKTSWPKVVMPLLAIIAVAGFTFFTYGQVTTAKQDYERALAAKGAATGLPEDAIVSGAWIGYTAPRLEKAKASGKVVIVDFTADWCINCKFLKRTVLDRDPVRKRITGDGHVLLEVDNTSSAAPGWKYLSDLGQTGVPTLAIYGPAISKPIILNAYTPATVLDALDRAAGTNRSAAR
jgi:thiol:disulfide interchange protein DsbD